MVEYEDNRVLTITLVDESKEKPRRLNRGTWGYQNYSNKTIVSFLTKSKFKPPKREIDQIVLFPTQYIFQTNMQNPKLGM